MVRDDTECSSKDAFESDDNKLFDEDMLSKKIGLWRNDQVLYFYQDTLEKLLGFSIKLLNSYGFSQLHLLTRVNGDNNSH